MTTTQVRPGGEPDFSRLRLGQVPIVLMYHMIADVPEDPHKLAVAPARFAEQMAWLAERGLRGVSMETLMAAMRAGRARGPRSALCRQSKNPGRCARRNQAVA